VIASGLRQTGVLRRAAHLLFGAETRIRAVLLRLSAASASSSAFLNNTPIVAMGIPAVLGWTRDRDMQASKLLIPLSYASILGGVCTLIGTSTNLVADGMLREKGMAGLGFFELGALGLPLTLLGIGYLVIVAPRLLPDRVNVESPSRAGTLARDIHLSRVPAGSSAVGCSVRENRLNTPDLQLVRLVHEDGSVVQVTPDAVILEGDRLTLRGDVTAMRDAEARLGLEDVPVEHLPELTGAAELREGVVAEGSELVGDTIEHASFHERYGAAVLGVVRGDRQLDDIEGVRLRAGDVLLLVAPPDLDSSVSDPKNLHLLGGHEVEPEAFGDEALWQPTRAKVGTGILVVVVAVATAGILHISLAALGGALAMIVAGFVSPAEARRSIDWSVLIVIGAAIGLAAALDQSGAAALVAEGIVSLGEPFGPRGVLAALLVVTMVFTLTITNNAAVAIIFPVALAVASSHGVDARPLIVTVTVGASLAFATPLGYQTNLMVYGPGGYRFGDFVRVGLPLQISLAAVTVFLAPLIWPF